MRCVLAKPSLRPASCTGWKVMPAHAAPFERMAHDLADLVVIDPRA